MNLRRRITIAAASITAAAAIVLTPGTASAIPACPMQKQCNYTYYDSADRDNVVGGWTNFCDGTWDRWGTRTSYLEYDATPCN